MRKTYLLKLLQVCAILTATCFALASAPSAQAKAKPKAFNGKTCTIVGTNKSETLKGTSKADVICGMGGNDVLSGGSGNDTLDGGAGEDILNGDNGNDVMNGRDGNDKLRGGIDRDEIAGGAGTDTVDYSEKTNPVTVNLDGRSGDGVAGEKDTVKTDIENIIGGSVIDVLTGNDGQNKISGGSGDDKIVAGKGDDSVDAGPGNDSVKGGDGNDKIIGGNGSDYLEGDGGTSSDTEENFCDPGSAGDTVSNCTIDQSGPKVKSVALSEVEINTTDSEKTVRLSIEATDDLFGAALIECGAALPYAGINHLKATATLNSGNLMHGVYNCDLKFPQFSRPGTYFFNIRLVDLAQSTANYYGQIDNQFREQIPGCTTELQCSLGPKVAGQSSIKVLGDGDLTLPEFTSINFSSESFSTTDSAYELTVNIGLVDTKSGISAVGLSECYLVLAQEWRVMRAAYPCSTPTLQTGNANNGIWQTKITVPKFAPQGSYSLNFSFSDNAGNRVGVVGSATENAYFDNRQIDGQYAKLLNGTSIIRQTGIGDTRLPILRNFSYSTNAIDTSLGRAIVTIQFTVDPDLSGFKYATCSAFSNSTATYLGGQVLFSGTSGTCTLSFAGGLPRGTYRTFINVYTTGTWVQIESKTNQNGFEEFYQDYEPAGNANGSIINGN